MSSTATMIEMKFSQSDKEARKRMDTPYTAVENKIKSLLSKYGFRETIPMDKRLCNLFPNGFECCDEKACCQNGCQGATINRFFPSIVFISVEFANAYKFCRHKKMAASGGIAAEPFEGDGPGYDPIAEFELRCNSWKYEWTNIHSKLNAICIPNFTEPFEKTDSFAQLDLTHERFDAENSKMEPAIERLVEKLVSHFFNTYKKIIQSSSQGLDENANYELMALYNMLFYKPIDWLLTSPYALIIQHNINGSHQFIQESINNNTLADKTKLRIQSTKHFAQRLHCFVKFTEDKSSISTRLGYWFFKKKSLIKWICSDRDSGKKYGLDPDWKKQLVLFLEHLECLEKHLESRDALEDKTRKYLYKEYVIWLYPLTISPEKKRPPDGGVMQPQFTSRKINRE